MAAKLIALVVPLGLGAFAVAAALGTVGVSPERRLRIGGRLSERLPEGAGRLAGAALIGLGAVLLAEKLLAWPRAGAAPPPGAECRIAPGLARAGISPYTAPVSR